MLLATVTVLAAVFGMTVLAQKAAQFGPEVGDLVTFNPARPAPLDNGTRLTAARSRQTSCVLDLPTIQQSGGSLVIEQRGIGPGQSYRAHWAGPRTSEDPSDCGPEADLTLSQFDIDTLATAAGGFGVTHTFDRPPG
jgi:hypothetical protein